MEEEGLIPSDAPLSEVFEQAYAVLVDSYPAEYVGLNEAVCREMRASGPIQVIRELAILGCKADLSVFTPGHSVGIEVKSRFDRLERLPMQLRSYQEAFSETWVVAAPQHAQRVLAESPLSVGVHVLSGPDLEEVRPARESIDLVQHQALFSLLRKPEYLRLIQERFGGCPEAPSTRIYRACLAQFQRIDISEAMDLVSGAIWDRGSALEAIQRQASRLPRPLRALAMTANLVPSDLIRLAQIIESEPR